MRKVKTVESTNHDSGPDILQGGVFTFKGLPDFESDLNALHDAESYLSNSQKEKYLNLLTETFGASQLPFLTAKQKSEALLRVI